MKELTGNFRYRTYATFFTRKVLLVLQLQVKGESSTNEDAKINTWWEDATTEQLQEYTKLGE